MRLILNWLVSTAAVIITAFLLPGVSISNLFAAFIAALVIGFVNAFIRPLLLVFTLPLNIATLGLFTLVLNALLILLAAEVVPGFYVNSFWSALLFSIVLWLVNQLLKVRDERVEFVNRKRVKVESEEIK